MAQYACAIEWLFAVPAQAFYPQPKVESAVIRLTPITPEVSAQDHAQLAKLVTQAFSQRRKTIHNSLRGLFSSTQLQQLGISPQSRAEELSVADFARLANAVN